MADDFNNTTDFGVVKVLMLKGEKGDTGDRGSDGISGDYAGLTNKPTINGVQVNGNQVSGDLGLASETGLQVVANRVTQAESNITGLRNDLTTTDGNVSNLRSDVDTILVDLPVVKQDVQDLQSDLAGVHATLDVDAMTLRRRLTSSDDLNNVTVNGIYYYATSSVPANAYYPNAAILEVVGNGSGAVMQKLTRVGLAGESAFRVLLSGTWYEWTEFAAKEAVGTRKTVTISTGGYLTSSNREIRFSVPSPILMDEFVVEVLALAVRHVD